MKKILSILVIGLFIFSIFYNIRITNLHEYFFKEVNLIKSILVTITLFVMYYIIEPKHDYAVSKDSKGGVWNKVWHQEDFKFHLMISVLVLILSQNILFPILVGTSRGLLFDKHFGKLWKGEWNYVGTNESKFKKDHKNLFLVGSILLYITNISLIFLNLS